MSSSQHPVALRLESFVRGPTKLLATVMCLPLLDGIFPALVLSGALSDPVGVVEVGLLIFGGSATVAVILAEMGGTRKQKIKAVLAVGALLVTGAFVEAALAPTISQLLDLATFERFAGIVILAIAAKTASARVGEWLPSPGVIIGLGLLASLSPSGASLTVQTDLALIGRAVAAAGVGTGFALAVAVLAPTLRTAVDIDRFRFGSAVALGILPLSIFGVLPSEAPIALAVLAVTAMLAFDPPEDDAGSTAGEPTATDGGQTVDPVAADTLSDETEPVVDDVDGGESGSPRRASNYLTTDSERAPWL